MSLKISGSDRNQRSTLTLGNGDVIDSYITKFRASLDSLSVYYRLVQDCERYGHHDLCKAARSVGDGGEDVLEHEAFILFLKGDGEPVQMVDRYHAERLADLDEFMIPLAVTIKAAARKKLECEFAIWQAHAQLLIAAKSDPRVLDRISRRPEMEKLLQADGFRLHETLCFAEIWSEVLVEHGGT